MTNAPITSPRLKRLVRVFSSVLSLPLLDPEQIEKQCSYVLEHGGVEGINDLLPPPFATHEIGGREDIEVVRQRPFGDLERLRELTGSFRPALQQAEHLAAGGIRDRFEDFLGSHGILIV